MLCVAYALKEAELVLFWEFGKLMVSLFDKIV